MPWIGPAPSSPSSSSDCLPKRTLDLAPRTSAVIDGHGAADREMRPRGLRVINMNAPAAALAAAVARVIVT